MYESCKNDAKNYLIETTSDDTLIKRWSRVVWMHSKQFSLTIKKWNLLIWVMKWRFNSLIGLNQECRV